MNEDEYQAHRAQMKAMRRDYRIIRFYKDAGINQRTILRNLTLAEAREHCSDPETSSSTAKGKVARARTRKVGDWFDGYSDRG